MPALLTLLALIPTSCLFAALGYKKGILLSLGLFLIVAVANGVIASQVEFGEFGLILVLVAVFAMPILLLMSWHAGDFLREMRLPGKASRIDWRVSK